MTFQRDSYTDVHARLDVPQELTLEEWAVFTRAVLKDMDAEIASATTEPKRRWWAL